MYILTYNCILWNIFLMLEKILFFFKSLLISTSIVLSLLYVVAAAPEDLDALQTRELKLEQDEKPYENEEYPSVETKEGGYGHYESYVSYFQK